MKLRHLRELEPVCPRCREGPIAVSQVVRGDDATLDEGLLICRGPTCRQEFPVVDGIPILVRDVRRVVADQILAIASAGDLSEPVLALLGECCGPGSTLDAQRQHLSTYIDSHFGDHDPADRAPRAPVAILVETGLERLVARPVVGHALDVGCSVGRATFELARRRDSGLVLGVDLSFSMLRAARAILARGEVRYPRRRLGLVYEERCFPFPVEGADRIDFWCADALALPFRPATFGLAVSLNLVDCVGAPVEQLRGLGEVLRPSGAALVSTPFDWNPTATPPETWLGGRSPRAVWKGEEVLASMLGKPPLERLALLQSVPGVEWTLRLHDRSTARYVVDLFVLGT